MMKKIKLGIIGCGAITQYAHLPAAQKSSLVELTAICDQAEDLLDVIAARHQVPQKYTDYHELLEKADVEAVILAVPDALHVPFAIDCLKAGKHLLIEKPVGKDLQDAQKLLDATAASQLKILVGNMKRHDPGIEFARKFCQDRIAPLFSINGWYYDTALRPQLQKTLLLPLEKSRAPLDPGLNPKADVENYSLLTHGAHLVNTLQFLGGAITRLVGRMVCQDGTYSWHALVEFKNGAIGNFELSVKIKADWDEGFVVHGQNGSVYGKTFLPFFRRPSEVRAFDIRTGITEAPVGADSDPYKRQLDSFALSILEDAPLVCTVQDAIQDLAVLDALKRSLRSERWEQV